MADNTKVSAKDSPSPERKLSATDSHGGRNDTSQLSSPNDEPAESQKAEASSNKDKSFDEHEDPNNANTSTISAESEKAKMINEKASQLPEKEDTPKEEPPVVPTPYIETDTEMGGLSDLMDRAIGFSTPPVSRVQVRKGYIFDLEVCGPEFWQKHDDLYIHRKRKIDDRREQRHGFFAADIIKYGAVDMLNPRPSNLSNEIHPLYQRDAFHGCEDEIYEQFIPALRLASMWMTQPVCFQFWVTLANGNREVDQVMSQRFGRLQHRIHHDAPLTPKTAVDAIAYIRSISNGYRMSFTFQENFKRDGHTYFGGTNKICDVGWENEDRAPNHLLRIYTKLSSDYYVAAKKLSQLKYPDMAQVLRFHFGLAVLLVHETCHAIELAHIRTRPQYVADPEWDPRFQQWIGHEPFFYSSIRPELGLTWEMYLFGGRILPINDRVDCLHGLCVFDWPDKDSPLFDPSTRQVYTIPMTYIEKMFQMSTWEKDFDLRYTKIFHIPRSGAKSVYLTHFTTMDYDEEQRIKDEEAAEALTAAAAKWEEPADKKRRTSVDGGEVLIASEASVKAPIDDNDDPSSKEEEEEVGKVAPESNDADKQWVAVARYFKAQPRRPDGSFVQKEAEWPGWVKEFFKRADQGLQNKVGIHIAENHNSASGSEEEDDDVPPKAQQQQQPPPQPRKDRWEDDKDRRGGRSPRARNKTGSQPKTGDAGSAAAAARKVGLGSGKKR
ncbi:MAG: hypothetical protein Q9191_005279 [Dirinaria sp. TL-2023a]